MRDAGYGIRDVGFGIWDTRCAMWDSGYGMRDTRCVIRDMWCAMCDVRYRIRHRNDENEGFKVPINSNSKFLFNIPSTTWKIPHGRGDMNDLASRITHPVSRISYHASGPEPCVPDFLIPGSYIIGYYISSSNSLICILNFCQKFFRCLLKVV